MYTQQSFWEEKNELAEACQRCAELGYVTSSGGNLSIRVSENEILITPTKTPKRCISAEHICVIDLNGKTLYAPEGLAPTGETPFHVRMYQKRADIKGVVHAHPSILTGFAIANNDMLTKPFLPEPIIEIGPILTVPYETPLTDELSDNIEKFLPLSNGFLLENHGAVFCSGKGVMDALDMLQMAEEMAKSVFVAKVLGNAKTITPYYVKKLDDVLHVRSLKMPGDPSRVTSLVELYNLEENSPQ